MLDERREGERKYARNLRKESDSFLYNLDFKDRMFQDISRYVLV